MTVSKYIHSLLFVFSKLLSKIYVFRFPTNERTNWFENLYNGQMYDSQHLHTWVIIVSTKLVPLTRNFVGIMQTEARRMEYNIAEPE